MKDNPNFILNRRFYNNPETDSLIEENYMNYISNNFNKYIMEAKIVSIELLTVWERNKVKYKTKNFNILTDLIPAERDKVVKLYKEIYKIIENRMQKKNEEINTKNKMEIQKEMDRYLCNEIDIWQLNENIYKIAEQSHKDPKTL